MHHKQHSQQSKLSNSSHQQKWLQQQPTSTLSPPSPTHLARSASSVTSQQQVNRLARSSSLSHHSNQIVKSIQFLLFLFTPNSNQFFYYRYQLNQNH
jgi:hypothetical protein